jgi:hypothetical protein
LTDPAFSLCSFLGQDVIAESLAPNNLSVPRGFEPLRSTAVGFHFWHFFLLQGAGQSAAPFMVIEILPRSLITDSGIVKDPGIDEV